MLGVARCYAVSVLYAGRTVRGVPPLQVSLGQLACAAVLMAPFGLAQLPETMPAAKVWLAVIALGALGSGIAYLLYFAIIASAGASRAILVTYLVPAFALAYGAVFLDEAITATALVGLALVLAGTALATGLARARAASLSRVTRRYWPLILTLASVWGASYLFIKVGVDGGLSPGALMAARALLAGVVLLGYLAVTLGARGRRCCASAKPGASRSCSACSMPRSRSGSSPGARSTSTRARRASRRRPSRSSRC